MKKNAKEKKSKRKTNNELGIKADDRLERVERSSSNRRSDERQENRKSRPVSHAENERKRTQQLLDEETSNRKKRVSQPPEKRVSQQPEKPRRSSVDDADAEAERQRKLEKRKSNAVKRSDSTDEMKEEQSQARKQRRFSSPVPPVQPEAKDPVTAPGNEDEDLCKICYENKIECVILECGHRILCGKCARLPLKECPICRKKNIRIVKTFDG